MSQVTKSCRGKELPWKRTTTSRLPSSRRRRRRCRRRREEFLYVACLHEGTGVEEPDFLAVVDAEEGRDRPRDCRCPTSATSCTTSAGTLLLAPATAPDRSHLIVPGFRSSPHPRRGRRRRPAPAADREGDRAGGGHREDRAHRARTPSTACRTATIVISMLGDARGQRPRRLRGARREDFNVEGRWENGGRGAAATTTTSGTSRATT